VAKASEQKMEILESNFKALAVPSQQLVAMLQNNLGTQITAFDLDRVKVPAGGGTTWEVPSLTGMQKTEVLEGIILHLKDTRSYWSKKFGGGNVPPDCASSDMLRGVGKPGGDCLKCPMAQFGTAPGQDGKPGRGQACKHVRLMLFLRQDDLIPLLVPVPPSSVKGAKKYSLRLVGGGYPYQGVVTQLRLTKTKNNDGIEYGQIEFSMARKLETAELERVMTIAGALKEVFAKAEVVAADVDGA
jgi:hypothetical protein